METTTDQIHIKPKEFVYPIVDEDSRVGDIIYSTEYLIENGYPETCACGSKDICLLEYGTVEETGEEIKVSYCLKCAIYVVYPLLKGLFREAEIKEG